jgi:GNAT superfamily N-acetyltransferase
MREPTPDIRPAVVADLGAVTALLVAQLREHAVDTPSTAIGDAVEAVVRHPERGRILVARDRGTVVGVAALSFVWPIEHGGMSAWLEELYVVPDARGHGIGTALLRAALDAANEAGAVAVDLEVDVGHERAANLYAREGFRPLPRARWVRPLRR